MKRIVSDEIKEIQVELLKYLDYICKINNIDYFLMSGSLIGAIRHNGFIPWDDDIDVGLTRENYKRLLNVLKETSHDKYFILDHEIQEDYYYPFAKLIDKRTTLVDKRFKDIENYGVYIDIFAMDKIVDNKTLLKKHYKKLKRCQMLIYMYAYDYRKERKRIRKFIKYLVSLIMKHKSLDKLIDNYNKVSMEYENTESKLAISNWPLYSIEREIQIYSNYLKITEHKFENIIVKIPVEYDKILSTHFGDYMTLPPENKRINHQNEAYWKNK